MIWDDHQNRCIGELSFRSEVRAVRLRRDRIVVVLEFKIYFYNFADLKLLYQTETLSNTKGIGALSPHQRRVLACPGQRKGEVRVELYGVKKQGSYRRMIPHRLASHFLSMELSWQLQAIKALLFGYSIRQMALSCKSFDEEQSVLNIVLLFIQIFVG